MRTAYLITSHQLPHQVLRLVSTLRRGNSEAAIVVHHDDRLCRLDSDVLDALEARRVEPPSRVGWGEVSHLKTVLRCLRWTLESVDFDWVVLLSGQDYPIRPVSAIEQSLGEAQVDAFIETRRCDHPSLWAPIDEFALRYHYRWRRVPRPLAAPLVRAAARAGPLLRARTMPSGQWIGVPALRSPFGSELVCHRGSDWFTLSRRAVEALERFVRARR